MDQQPLTFQPVKRKTSQTLNEPKPKSLRTRDLYRTFQSSLETDEGEPNNQKVLPALDIDPLELSDFEIQTDIAYTGIPFFFEGQSPPSVEKTFSNIRTPCEQTVQEETSNSKTQFEVVMRSYGLSVIKLIRETISLPLSKDFDYLIILPQRYSEIEEVEMKNQFNPSDDSETNANCGFCNVNFSASVAAFTDKVKSGNRVGYLCKLCDGIEYRPIRRNQHILKHVLSKDVFCVNCNKMKHSLAAIYGDQSTIDRSIGKLSFKGIWRRFLYLRTTVLQCQKCKTVVGEGGTLKKKLLRNVFKGDKDIDSYKCNICEEILDKNRGRAEFHVLSHFTMESVFCSKCLLGNSTLLAIDQPITPTEEPRMIIDELSDVYSTLVATSLDSKLHWTNYGEYFIVPKRTYRLMRYRCKECKKEFPQHLENLRKHISKLHIK